MARRGSNAKRCPNVLRNVEGRFTSAPRPTGFDQEALELKPEWRAWMEMRRRCRPSSKKYRHNYSDRGIVVCARWEDSFFNFFHDVGPRPSPQHSLDRIDNDGNYEPGNVRWATVQEQNQNRSNTLKFTRDGVTRTLREWADDAGVPYVKAWDRIKRRGWSLEEALS